MTNEFNLEEYIKDLSPELQEKARACKTKDELLHTMCGELFEHVFSSEFKGVSPHDIPEGADPLSFRIHHICSHLYDNRNEIVRIMRFDSSEIYKYYLKGYLEALFKERAAEMSGDIPESFVMKQLTDTFISALEWWAGEGMETTPAKVAGYYCDMYPSK